jgi:hypothetical protein
MLDCPPDKLRVDPGPRYALGIATASPPAIAGQSRETSNAARPPRLCRPRVLAFRIARRGAADDRWPAGACPAADHARAAGARAGPVDSRTAPASAGSARASAAALPALSFRPADASLGRHRRASNGPSRSLRASCPSSRQARASTHRPCASQGGACDQADAALVPQFEPPANGAAQNLPSVDGSSSPRGPESPSRPSASAPRAAPREQGASAHGPARPPRPASFLRVTGDLNIRGLRLVAQRVRRALGLPAFVIGVDRAVTLRGDRPRARRPCTAPA